METFLLADITQTSSAAQWILEMMGDRKILLLQGQLGAGKTTLTKAICNLLGCSDTVSSPTFSIIQTYACHSGLVYHIDLYRLKNTVEAYDVGVEEALYSGEMCIVEWPEKIVPLLPDNYTLVNIEVNNNLRHLQLENYG